MMASGMSTLMILTLIMFGMNLMGYHSGMNDLMSNWIKNPATGEVAGIGDLSAMLGILMVGIVAAAGTGVAASALGSNFGVIYAIPAAIMQFFVIGLFLVPISFLTEGVLPYPIDVLASIIFGIMTIFTVISFVRGGEV